MKLFAVVAALLFCSLVTTESLPLFGGQEVLDSYTNLSVPGDNPLQFCQDTSESDILIIEHVNLTPNPPQAGTTLTIEAAGTLTEDVEEGAYVNLQVKYGLIRLINQRADLCEQVKNVDLECPIKKGETALTKDVNLPEEIPPGKYTVLADVYTKDDRKITCLTATVVFSKD